MIYIGNLILRTMIFEYFNNSLYFKSYGRFLEKKTHLVPWYKDRSKNFWVGYPGLKPRFTGPFFLKDTKSI